MTLNKKPSRFAPNPDCPNLGEPDQFDIRIIFNEVVPSRLNDGYFTAQNLEGASGFTYCGMKIGTTPLHACHVAKIKDFNGTTCNGLFLTQSHGMQYDEAFIPGARLAGCFCRVGTLTDTILITESYATAHWLHRATGHCVAVVLFVENIETVCKILNKKYPAARLIVFADDDELPNSKGRATASISAAANGGALIASTNKAVESNDENTDSKMLMMRNAIESASVPYLGTQSGANVTNLEHNAPIPWSRPVNGGALFDNIVAIIEKYVVLPSHAILTMALWVLFTYFIDIFNIAPILALCSPEKRCGKTTSQELLGWLTDRPMLMSNITPAGFYQAIDQSCSTMIIDECDTFLFPSAQLIGMINAGYKRKGGKVVRGGTGRKSTTYNIFGARTLAMIGAAPSSIEDRSLVIWQRRKKSTELVERLSDATEGDFIAMRSLIARWAADNMNNVREANPMRPDLSSDRAVDNWMPLLAIASCISQECLNRANAAARALYESQVDESMSFGEELLFDVRAVFMSHDDKRIPTKTLISRLCMDRERRWASFDNRNPISARQLSTQFTKYGIKSKNIRIDNEVVKGYELQQFTDAFERYLPIADMPK
jgi:putative DNA primase/helicase